MRNANIYTAAIMPPLVVGSLDNAKRLNTGAPRAFPVFARNTTDKDRLYTFTIVKGSGVVWASFDEKDTPVVGELSVNIGAWSGAARTVYAKGAYNGQLTVNVTEVVAPRAPPARESVTLNPDPLSPAVMNPAVMNETFNPAVMNRTITNPAVMNPAVMNPAVMNPAVMNPADPAWALINPAVMNPAVMNPAVMNPAVMNPAVMNPAVMNPAVMNQEVADPAVMNPAVMNPAVMNLPARRRHHGRDVDGAERRQRCCRVCDQAPWQQAAAVWQRVLLAVDSAQALRDAGSDLREDGDLRLSDRGADAGRRPGEHPQSKHGDHVGRHRRQRPEIAERDDGTGSG